MKFLSRFFKKKTVAPTAFYQPHVSCQIPELADLYRIFLGERKDGLFVEVGAYDGISFSNSSCLADVGWTGLLVEPIPAFAEMCRDRYASNPRIQIVECAAGSSESTIGISVAGALTTTNKATLDSYQKLDWAKPSIQNLTNINVPQQQLDSILEKANITSSIDVLIVDVEGAEASVFEGFSFQKWMPKLLIVELAHTHPDLHKSSAEDAKIQKTIESKKYSVIYKDAINTVFISDSLLPLSH